MNYLKNYIQKKISILISNFSHDQSCLAKNKKSLLLHILLSLVLYLSFSSSIFAKNEDFTITSVTYEFTSNSKYRNQGSIEYPEFSCNNLVVAASINDTVDKFINKFELSDSNYYHKANYQILESTKYFSIKWNIFNKKNKLIKISTLNFDIKTGSLLSADKIFDNTRNFTQSIIQLSKNRLTSDISWLQFLDKIAKDEIQFYGKKSHWYLIFNPQAGSNKEVIDSKIPKYLIKK
ncbi:MAG: hypothetical protein EOP33_03335 [Rickettsiaceae bacterium]|nr:MAG: hypothetical protein EOP33_03335 [Rickettsiaceae bacterium]